MDMIEILKYLGIGVIGIIVCFMGLAIIGNILCLMLDIVVFIIIAPFYILFHPILFVTKPMTCLKNIFMKTPCFGEDYACSKVKIDPDSPYSQGAYEMAQEFHKLCEKWYWDDYFNKKRK